MNSVKVSLVVGVLAAGALPVPAANSDGLTTAATLIQPAIDGIFEGFRNHPLVGLGDDHGLSQAMEFYAALVRDPRFAREVGNVVVEFGAAGRQDVIDRYVSGEAVPYAELRSVWTDTVGWNPPPGQVGFARFFATVRAVNKGLPADRRIRIWLGEPPIDWSTATRDRATSAMNQRDSYPAGLITDNILAKGRKSLVIYGHAHFANRGTLRERVEAKNPGAFYLVIPYSNSHRPAACAPLVVHAAKVWPTPALAAPRAGAVPDSVMRDCSTYNFTTMFFSLPKDGAAAVPPTAPAAGSQAFNAVLFYGPLENLTQGPFLPDYVLDTEYRREMNRRSQVGGPWLIRLPAGYSFRKADYAIDLEAPGFQELVDSMFAQHDLNKDGVVSAEEYVDPIPR
jgi:hypothetical protein